MNSSRFAALFLVSMLIRVVDARSQQASSQAAPSQAAPSQTAPARSAPAPVAQVPAWLASLTPEQRALFDEANKGFNTNDFAAALPKLKQLHEQVPKNDVITKFEAEAAVNTGDYALAASLLDGILAGTPDDPQALGIQAHLYGQQHDVARRDALLEHIQKMHDGGKPAPLRVIVENDKTADGGTVRISDYIQPWSQFHIVLLAEYFDAAGQRTHRTSIESDDIDQMNFKKDHPDEAAKGVRLYTMDGYSETRNAQGQVTGGTHSLLCPVPNCFMQGRPAYEMFRTSVLGNSKVTPITSTTGPAKPSK
jgi:hypothetical protein